MLKNWLKIYWYNTMKHKMYFLLTVVGLAIGIASITLASLYYLEEKSYNQWNPNKDEVYVIENLGKRMMYSSQPLTLGRYIHDNSGAVESYMYYGYYRSVTVNRNGKSFEVKKALDSQNTFFSFFPYDFVYGNAQTALVNLNDVALEVTLAERIFGQGVNPIGQEILFDDQNYIVAGVYEIGKKRSSLMPELVTHSLTQEAMTNNDWGSASTPMLVKTKDTHRVSEIIESVIDDNLYAGAAKDKGMSLDEYKKTVIGDMLTRPTFYSLKDIHMMNGKYFFSEASANLNLLYITIGLSVALLLLSIFNYINLSLTQMMERGKEIGVRKVLGAKRMDIYLQCIFESSLMVLTSFVLAICVMELLLPYINIFLNVNISISFIQHIFIIVAILIVVIVLCGFVPAMYISRHKAISVLKGRIANDAKGSLMRNSLLVLQFVIACFFIIGSIIINKQVNYMLNKDLGFKGDQIISVPFLSETKYDSIRFDKYNNFKTEVQNVTGVINVTASSMVFGPLGGRNVFSFFEKGEDKLLVSRIVLDYDYLDVMQIKLKEGRMLSDQFASDSINNVLVNEAFIEMFNIKEPINSEIVSNKKKYTVVGVIQNFNLSGVENGINPQVFAHHATFQGAKGLFEEVSIKVEPERVEQVLKDIEKLWLKYNNESKIPFDYEFVDKQFAKTFDRVLLERKMFGVLSNIVVFIALFGLFAVSSFTIGTKLREVAIRKVLGAETTGLLRQLSYQYVVYCLVGFGIAVFPSYYFLNKWLANYAYRIEIGWGVYVYSLLLILGLTLLIVISRAYKATRVDVLKYIKYE
ncbi:ABC transporter permease [Myroides albus]|uniref:ABC transporter permease n=1 Tax=Myroides albus TaxID=2562892 RepID=UPI0021591C87|nr:ABC transporter permease [Myroides albus]UVD81257.1 ABC transporter permease [Myroides albus]